MANENELTFREAIDLFQVFHRFEKIEGKPWGVEGAMIELVKQVGELAKHIMVAEHYYFAGREKMRGYAPGIIASVLLYLPLSVYACYVFVISGQMTWLEGIASGLLGMLYQAVPVGYLLLSSARRA